MLAHVARCLDANKKPAEMAGFWEYRAVERSKARRDLSDPLGAL